MKSTKLSIKKAGKLAYLKVFRGGVPLKALTAALFGGCLGVAEVPEIYAAEILPPSASGHVSWEETEGAGNDTVDVSLPDGTKKYYKYTYNKPLDYSESSVPINNALTNTNVNNVLFQNISSSSNGVVIYNTQDKGTIDIIADFVNNEGANTVITGGAIYNSGLINSVQGDFINNSVNSSTGNGCGAAIYNSGTIGSQEVRENAFDIEGNFIGNKITSNAQGFGAAIYNDGNLALKNGIKGNFINNSITSNIETRGAAIINYAKIGDITGLFVGNNVTSIGDTALNFADGGAIFNNGHYGENRNISIGNITADFNNNFAISNISARGGAIFNTSKAVNTASIGVISGDFTQNYVFSRNGNSYGGAIYNEGTNATIESIIGNFVGNHVLNTSSKIDSEAYGGALFNTGTIGDIFADFSQNYIETGNTLGYGGAIYNDGIINSIGSDTKPVTFYQNTITGRYRIYGGAIYNKKNINSINANFIENKLITADILGGRAWGAGIYSEDGIIGDITGDFIDNRAEGFHIDGVGIYNNYMSEIGNITGNFSGNQAISNRVDDGHAQAAAIYNVGKINNITGNFTNNYGKGQAAYGGALFNFSQINVNIQNIASINSINGDFTGNYLIMTGKNLSQGGAIYNNGLIADIRGNFKDNYIIGQNAKNISGGAIYNSKLADEVSINNIIGDFSNNHLEGKELVSGGAISNDTNSYIKFIDGDFSGNYGKSLTGDVSGGAIYNDGIIDNLEGNFSGNFAEGILSAGGGAVYNKKTLGSNLEDGTITGKIVGDFIGNYAKANGANAPQSSEVASGGAVLNHSGTITGIIGNFQENYVHAQNQNALAGALFNRYGKIGDIVGDFTKNYALADNGSVIGGVIYNHTVSADKIGLINSFKGNFTENYAIAKDSVYGVVINNQGTINKINGDFIRNYGMGSKSVFGGAINNITELGIIGDIKSNFDGNYILTKSAGDSNNGILKFFGGAINNEGSIANINGNFTGNYIKNEQNSAALQLFGGAIANTGTVSNIINGDFTGNYVENSVETSNLQYARGGAVYNSGTLAGLNGNFQENYVKATGQAYGGAIYNDGILNDLSEISFVGNYSDSLSGASYGGAIYNNSTNTNGLYNLTNVTFLNNFAHTTSGNAQGGAVWTNYDLNIKADNGITTFRNNYIQNGDDEKVYDAIYLGNAQKTLTFSSFNDGQILFYDNINGEHGYKINIIGDDSSSVEILGQVKNASTVTMDTTHFTFAQDTFNSEGLIFKAESGFIELADNEFKTYTIDKLTSNQITNWNLDIDLFNQKSDVIKTNKESSGFVYIDSVSYDNIPKADGVYKVQILQTQSSALQLALNSALNFKNKVKEILVDGKAEITSDVQWNQKFYDGHYKYTMYEQLGLGTTSTLNDSIVYTISTELTGTSYTLAGDTLHLWNTAIPVVRNANKNFNFVLNSDVYTLTDNIGVSEGEILNVNGIAGTEDDDKSTIDLAGYTGFVLNSGKTLNINNVKFINPVDSEGSLIKAAANAVINFKNVTITSSLNQSTIKNDGTLNFIDGTNNINTGISGSGTTNINNNSTLILAGNSITQNAINVNEGLLKVLEDCSIFGNLVIDTKGKAIISANGIKNSVSNDGALNLTGGTLSQNISGDGSTNITGSVVSNSTINQNINITGSLTSNAANIGGVVDNDGALNLTGGTLSQNISGEGSTNITGSVVSNSSINQNINITGSLTSNAANIGGVVDNDGSLNLTGGTLSQNISGDGSTNITGSVVSNSTINQNINITGSLTSNAANIGGVVDNDGALNLTGGTLSQSVSGEGSTNITGSVVSNSSINQNINITGSLTSNAANIGGVVDNDGALNLTGGTLSQNISGDGSTNIIGAVVNNAVVNQKVNVAAGADFTNNNDIGNVVNNGTLTSRADNLTGTIRNNNTLNLSGTLGKEVSGAGITHVFNTLTLVNGADIKGELNAAAGTNITVSGDENSYYSVGILTGNGDVNINGGNFKIKDNATLHNLINRGSSIITGTLIATGNIENYNTLSIYGDTKVQNLTNEGNLDISGSLLVRELLQNNGDIDIYGTLTAKNINNTGNLNVRNNAVVEVIGDINTTENLVTSGVLNVTGEVNAKDLTNNGLLSVGDNVEVSSLANNTNGEISIVGSLDVENNLENKKRITVDGLVTAQKVVNSGTLEFNNGAKLQDLTNTSSVNISNGLNANSITNESVINLSSGKINVDDIINTGQINLTNKVNAILNNSISGEGGNINIQDSIFTTNGNIRNQNVKLSNSTLNLGDNGEVLKSSILNVENSTINLSDGKYTNYIANELHSQNSKYNIDVVISRDEQKSDTFTLANGGSGKIFISSINIGGNVLFDDLNENEQYVLQIIKSSSPNAPELDYDNSKVLNYASENMSNDLIFAEGFGLATTDTKNDSLIIRGLKDVFCEWANFGTDNDKSFTFVNDAVYTLSKDLNDFEGENSNIIGMGNTFDINNKVFINEIHENQNVLISDINFINGVGTTVNKGSLTFNNVSIFKDIVNENILQLKNDVRLNNLTNNSKLLYDGKLLRMNTLTNNGKAEITGDFDVVTVNNNKELNINKSTFNVSKITSETTGDLNISDTILNAKGQIINQNIKALDSTINVMNPYLLVNDSLNLNKSTLNLGSLTLKPLKIETLNLKNSTIHIPSSDVDFKTNTMGKLDVNTVITDYRSVIDLQSLSLLNNPDEKKKMISIPFADKSYSKNILYRGQTELNAPVYKYGISYNPNTGDMIFTRGGKYNVSTGEISYPVNPSNQYNPAVFAGGVAAHTAATSTMNQVYQYAFKNSDNFMAFPLSSRLSTLNKNKFALTETIGSFEQQENASSWFKSYVNFETVDYKYGPKVHTTTYGSLAGFDTALTELKNGWARTYTGYIGYNGTSQSYNKIHTTSNGALVGGTMTLYKGNFFNATTVSTGASLAETNTFTGHDDITMLIGGVANKSGYNFEYKGGRFIVQPNLLLSYTFVNTFNYTNSDGVKIKSNPLHAIQAAPGVKVMANTENGWQPYIAVNMVMNFMDKTKITANNFKLPQFSTRPYVQYGIGVQKTFKDNFMAFGQTMFQSGGRHGVTLTGGIRWTIGKKKNGAEIVRAAEPSINPKQTSTRKVIKQLSPEYKAVFNAKNTTKTSSNGILKQL